MPIGDYDLMSDTERALSHPPDAEEILDTAPVLVWMSDTGGGAVYFNQPWLDFRGRSHEQETGEGWTEGLHPDDVTHYDETFRASLRQRQSFEVEYRLRRDDGQYRWISERARPHYDDDGTFLGYIGTCFDITAQKAARGRAERAERRLQAILDSAMDAIITIDEEHRITQFSRGAEQIFGWPADGAVGQHLGVLLPEEFRNVHDEHIRGFGRSGVGERAMSPREVWGLRANGERFPAEARISQADVDGSKVFTVILRDVTDRKRAEDSLAFLSEISKQLAYSMDSDKTLESIARVSLEYFADWCIIHLSRDDGHLDRVLTLHKDPARQELAARYPAASMPWGPLRRVMESGEPEYVPVVDEEMLQRAGLSEERRAVLLHDMGLRSVLIAPLNGREGCLGTVTFLTSESDRRYTGRDVNVAMAFARRAAVALEKAHLYERAEEERARLSTILEAVEYAVCQLDADGRIALMNPAAEALLGYQADAVLGTPFHQLVHEGLEDTGPCGEKACPTLTVWGSTVSGDDEDIFVHCSGATFPVRFRCSPIVVGEERVGSVIAFEDITERIAATQRKDDFLSFATHELRNPLTPILGLARWMDRKVRGSPEMFDEEMHEASETLAEESERMSRIVDVFLDLSRIESNRLVVEEGPVDLRKLVTSETESLLARYPGVTLETHVPSDECVVISDEGRLRQVIANLLSNAAKYGGDPATITVSLEMKPDAALLRVSDQGPGIASDDLPYIFERFHRSASASSKDGYGVGLYLTREIVRQLDGDVVCYSEPGNGAEFVVTLPGIVDDMDGA